MMPVSAELFKRHGNTHYANIGYGYYVLAVSVVYVAFLYGIKFIPRKWSQSNRFLRYVTGLSVPLHLLILMLPIFVPFVHHYSFREHVSVYIKRVGRLSYVLLSLNLFLTLRSPISPFRTLYEYADFLPLHKWLSRLIVILGLVHGIWFVAKWANDPNVSLVEKMWHKKRNTVGILISVQCLLLIILSLRTIRRKWYWLFYFNHNITNIGLLFLTAVHARPNIVKPYIFINCLLVIVHGVNRIWNVQRMEINYKLRCGGGESNFVIVSLPLTRPTTETLECSHVRVSPYRIYNPLYWLTASHPYTVVEQTENDLKLVINESTFKMIPEKQYSVQFCGFSDNAESPITRSIPEDPCTRIVIVAGGSGISYTIPFYRQLTQRTQYTNVQFVWITRRLEEYEFIEQNLRGLLPETAEIYVTGNPLQEQRAIITTTTPAMHQDGGTEGLDFEAIELGQWTPQQQQQQQKQQPGGEQRKIHSGRFEWGALLGRSGSAVTGEQPAEGDRGGGTWLLSCGPESLVDSASRFAQENGYGVQKESYSV
ncbi:putative metalloreductase KNAG_0I00580 [Huiozyma naganishii CBS 8797]|uniref:FAD-binding FR-type domain-containing protein n=1 Tax=Huiozyma naganishii (strain ATCC MYA-139 / BCRC 22969 / CBS 8797 / KCTC 17520 / NBRC 10181 / NCYC 3082 / Yp74L-3) TaxID=1071383 RepID=J7S909_HUIN7|nr:hypothetical protein KNAG_0I00580 [Kazachstania naganishii CBS 8797]CCK71849.1 hypothetical protein KNAG_0I00580 [Kazachstania naganishii CBS 8797]